jgi:hypothetical protein
VEASFHHCWSICESEKLRAIGAGRSVLVEVEEEAGQLTSSLFWIKKTPLFCPCEEALGFHLCANVALAT